MSARQLTPRATRWLGTLASAVGLYFLLVGLGVLPIPGGPDNLNGPLWVVLLAGLVFFLGGAAVLLQGIGRANDDGEFPPEAPRWMRVTQYLVGIAIFASLALIGSWVAIGGDARYFSGGVPLIDHATNVTIARVLFGVGAAITWLCAIACAVSGAHKLFQRRE